MSGRALQSVCAPAGRDADDRRIELRRDASGHPHLLLRFLPGSIKTMIVATVMSLSSNDAVYFLSHLAARRIEVDQPT